MLLGLWSICIVVLFLLLDGYDVLVGGQELLQERRSVLAV
jgi:hypothetical protein